MRRRAVAPAGRRCACRLSSSIGLTCAEPVLEAVGLDERRGRPRGRRRRPAQPGAGSATAGGRARFRALGAEASSTADATCSRCRRAIARLPYLAKITSPCSVTLKWPPTEPGAWARTARLAGPPPRPSAPPRPWKRVSRNAVARRPSGELFLRVDTGRAWPSAGRPPWSSRSSRASPRGAGSTRASRRTGASFSIASITAGDRRRSATVSNSGITSRVGATPPVAWRGQLVNGCDVIDVAREAHDVAPARLEPEALPAAPRSRPACRAPPWWPPTAGLRRAPLSRARAWMRLCWRTSSSARWKPNVSACQIRCCSSPYARRAAPAAASDACTVRRSSSRSAARPNLRLASFMRVARIRSATWIRNWRCGSDGERFSSSAKRFGSAARSVGQPPAQASARRRRRGVGSQRAAHPIGRVLERDAARARPGSAMSPRSPRR